MSLEAHLAACQALEGSIIEGDHETSVYLSRRACHGLGDDVGMVQHVTRTHVEEGGVFNATCSKCGVEALAWHTSPKSKAYLTGLYLITYVITDDEDSTEFTIERYERRPHFLVCAATNDPNWKPKVKA